MNAHAIALRRGRTPGERAFDRCFLPVAVCFVPSVVAATVDYLLRASHELHSEDYLEAAPPAVEQAWPWWLAFVFGLLLAGLWVRAFVSVVRVWHDPSTRVLRFSALVLLVPFAALAWSFLTMPFR